MKASSYNPIEKIFLGKAGTIISPTNFPYLVVDSFPLLGFLTALRFIKWVSVNPNGVISLPSGKTPEFFILWTAYLLENWETAKGEKIREEYNLGGMKKPDLKNLRFVQMDEFYPIPSSQHNSFCNYVKRFYIQGFGLDPDRALFIDSDAIKLPGGRHYSEVFPNAHIDLSLRYREPMSSFEKIQQQSIFAIDNWCSEYEAKIRNMGGLGFFLGGIGPDGHIAFNTKGTDHHSTTRLTETNFETQAVAASDLGGMEISRKRPVITIGLETITFNPYTVAILFAAGEAKASMVKNALEQPPSNLYPATALSKLNNARFYLTKGAASTLNGQVATYYDSNGWNQEKTDRAITDLCSRLGKYAHHLTMDDLTADEYCKKIPDLSLSTIDSVIQSTLKKIEKGMTAEQGQVYYHTGPHHDDIMLGLLPHIHRLLRNESNKARIAIMTSGFTSVTNRFIIDVLQNTRQFLDSGLIQMTDYPDFFKDGYKRKRDKDVYHYLIKVASGEPYELQRGLSHRVVRALVEIYEIKNKAKLHEQIDSTLKILSNSHDGEKNPESIQRLKGMIREFEEELVWAYFGIQTEHVHHLRLGFYTGNIFTEQPNRDRDVEPLLKQLMEVNPSVISLAFDPEGSGPDTHYKVLQVIAEAVRLYKEKKDLSGLRIWGYRNVWYRFHPAEANVIVPVSLNAMAVMSNAFTNSYMSQVDASFPSPLYDGKFDDLAKKIWVEQLKTIQLLLGKNFFYQHLSPRIRATHGMLFYKEMSVDEFLSYARNLEESMEGLAGRLYQ